VVAAPPEIGAHGAALARDAVADDAALLGEELLAALRRAGNDLSGVTAHIYLGRRHDAITPVSGACRVIHPVKGRFCRACRSVRPPVGLHMLLTATVALLHTKPFLCVGFS